MTDEIGLTPVVSLWAQGRVPRRPALVAAKRACWIITFALFTAASVAGIKIGYDVMVKRIPDLVSSAMSTEEI